MGHVTALGATADDGARRGPRRRATLLRWQAETGAGRRVDDATRGRRAARRRRRRQPLGLPGPRGRPSRSSTSSASPAELRVVSAHRTPDHLFRYAEEAAGRGIRVIIAGAGGAAHLPGMLAAKTILPVIGVPIPTQHLGGMDSLLSIVQMPRGIPVATVAIGNATNAGLLAAQILALGDDGARRRGWPPGARARPQGVLDDPSNAGG